MRLTWSIEGYVWFGKSLLPRLLFYAFFFIGAFIVQVSVILLSLITKNLITEINFWVLTGTTLLSMTLFLKESIGLYHKLKPKRINEE